MNKNNVNKIVTGESIEDGNSVIWTFRPELPSVDIMKKFPLLTVITWDYDGNKFEGMPERNINELMIELENQIKPLNHEVCTQVYSRKGNNLKELVYYINDRNEFIKNVKEVLKDKPKYPIEINFYDDPKWEDYIKILEQFNSNQIKLTNGSN